MKKNGIRSSGELQDSVFAFIRSFVKKNHKGPTATEIAQHVGGTKQNALEAIRGLEAKGRIRRDKDADGNAIPRAIKIVDGKN